MTRIDEERLNRTIVALRERLLAAKNAQGHWVGIPLQQRPVAATAVFGLGPGLTPRGMEGGSNAACAGSARTRTPTAEWGDTVQSPSNLSTTLLCYSAMSVLEGGSLKHCSGIARSWKIHPIPMSIGIGLEAATRGREGRGMAFRREVGSSNRTRWLRRCIARYGKDRRFPFRS
jgi:squalene-hopene/tetraprenyl-beta-curcumene cyclase